MIDKYRLDHLRLESGEKGELARWVIQLQTDLDRERRKVGNSPVIPDDVRDALAKALAAMEFMGDTLNDLDAVCAEDAEFVAPAFEAVRRVLTVAPQ